METDVSYNQQCPRLVYVYTIRHDKNIIRTTALELYCYENEIANLYDLISGVSNYFTGCRNNAYNPSYCRSRQQRPEELLTEQCL